MIKFELLRDRGILLITPSGPLEKGISRIAMRTWPHPIESCDLFLADAYEPMK